MPDVDSYTLNILSLCTGAGALDLGVEIARPGVRTIGYVEREAFACAALVSAVENGVLADAPVWTDLATFKGRPWRGAVDCVIGGIPCQPYSLAGKRAGSDDERDCWPDARRAIVQSGAWVVFIENVGGILSAGSKDKISGGERIKRDLERLGFHVEGGLFSAAEVGGSHERQRMFFMAIASGARLERYRRHGGHGNKPGRVGAAAGRSVGAQRVPMGDAEDDDGRREFETRRAGLWWAESTRAGDEGALVDAASFDRGLHARPWRDGAGAAQSTRRSEDVADPDSGTLRAQSKPIRERRDPAQPSDDGAALVDTDNGGCGRRAEGAQQGAIGRVAPEWAGRGMFPPGPAEIDRWRSVLERHPEFEPSLCRMVDGVATGVGIARIDRLRLLGNGVVPLAGAYAWRTLSARLAASGVPGAAELYLTDAELGET